MNPQEIQTEKTTLQSKAEALKEAAGAAVNSIFMPAAAKEQLKTVVEFAEAVADELQQVRGEVQSLRAEMQRQLGSVMSQRQFGAGL